VIEQHGAIAVSEGWFNEAPHVLIAPEAMGKDHCPVASAMHLDVISVDDAQ